MTVTVDQCQCEKQCPSNIPSRHCRMASGPVSFWPVNDMYIRFLFFLLKVQAARLFVGTVAMAVDEVTVVCLPL